MSENEHFAKAKSRLHNGTTNEVDRAQAEATLALAYEQRTANLIALWSNPQAELEDLRGKPVTYSLNESALDKVLKEITERLDLA